jgi:hypothetical protein
MGHMKAFLEENNMKNHLIGRMKNLARVAT